VTPSGKIDEREQLVVGGKPLTENYCAICRHSQYWRILSPHLCVRHVFPICSEAVYDSQEDREEADDEAEGRQEADHEEEGDEEEGC
jgi:hypothetical protein